MKPYLDGLLETVFNALTHRGRDYRIQDVPSRMPPLLWYAMHPDCPQIINNTVSHASAKVECDVPTAGGKRKQNSNKCTEAMGLSVVRNI